MTTAMAMLLGATFASAFWIVAGREMNESLYGIIRRYEVLTLKLRKRLDELERHELTEANNPPDWWHEEAQ